MPAVGRMLLEVFEPIEMRNGGDLFEPDSPAIHTLTTATHAEGLGMSRREFILLGRMRAEGKRVH